MRTSASWWKATVGGTSGVMATRSRVWTCRYPDVTTSSTRPRPWRSAPSRASTFPRRRPGLTSFTGAARRFQILGEAHGVTVVDDYAHHPTELRTTLAAARVRARGRVVVVVQPHRYSRTRVLGTELGRVAAAADVVVVTDVYAASEEPEPGISGHLVADAAEAAGARVIWQPHLGTVVDELAALAQPDDLVLVTGAGDVSQVGPALLERLRVMYG
jgi:UDP-N-acetylmuramate--alanine ligase